MNKIPPVATVGKREFAKCTGCGTPVPPGTAQCGLCERRNHYFGPADEPKADVPGPYGRHN